MTDPYIEAARALGATDDELTQTWQRSQAAGAPPTPPPDDGHRYQVERFWAAWKAAQMAKAGTLRYRKAIVAVLEARIRGDETEIPPGVTDSVETLLAMDAAEPRDQLYAKGNTAARWQYRDLARRWHQHQLRTTRRAQ